ncbi:hypothetical protein Q021_04910 [Pseudomonas aeruginosa BWHPSA008]|nr:hypothetical protein Q021_04910 [Pseudomonas aeruginosa BWHPSA008]
MLGSTGKMPGTAALRRAAGPTARRLPDGPHAALDPGQRPTALRHLPECPAAHQLPRFRLPFADGPARGGPGQMATLPSVPVLWPDQPGADRRLRPGSAELAWRRLRLPLPAFQRTHAGAALQAAAGVRNPVFPDPGRRRLRTAPGAQPATPGEPYGSPGETPAGGTRRWHPHRRLLQRGGAELPADVPVYADRGERLGLRAEGGRRALSRRRAQRPRRPRPAGAGRLRPSRLVGGLRARKPSGTGLACPARRTACGSA